MRSGYDNYEGIWGNEYYDNEFNGITDRMFSHRTFIAGDALVSIGPVGPDELPGARQSRHYEDGTVAIPYEGQPYDPIKFKLVSGDWDHEHCSACRFSIQEQNTFWQNSYEDILCDACYDHYILGK